MKKISIYAALALSAILSTSCVYVRVNKDGVKDYAESILIAEGPSVEEFRETGPFEIVRLTSSIDAEIVKGEPGVRVSAPENIIKYISVENNGGFLLVKMDYEGSGYSSINYRDSKISVKIYADTISSAQVIGSGDLEIGEGVYADDFSIAVAGSGDIEAEGLVCKSLKASISGSGDIDLRGIDCEVLEVSVAGSGDINLAGRADTASYAISGSGDIDARRLSAGSVSRDVKGSGDIRQ